MWFQFKAWLFSCYSLKAERWRTPSFVIIPVDLEFLNDCVVGNVKKFLYCNVNNVNISMVCGKTLLVGNQSSFNLHQLEKKVALGPFNISE